MTKVKQESINYFFKIHGISTKTCHEPEEKCKRQAICSHSIPSSTVLSQLASGGHLVMLQMRLKNPPPAEISFQLVGINKATTFSGLCDQHDNAIFRPIDDHLPNTSDPENLFLLAYRAVLREYHVVLQNAVRFQAAYRRNVELGISPGDKPCETGVLAVSHIMNAYECYEYKRQYDNAYLHQQWHELKHHVLLLHNQQPSIAVSSMFSLDGISALETPRIALSIFPMNNDTVAVFSSTKSDAPFTNQYLARLLTADSYFQKYLLSKMILQSCDNFVIAPDFFNALSQAQKDAMCQFYTDTILENDEEHDDVNLFLF